MIGPHELPDQGMLQLAIPVLPCDDVAAAVLHYRDVLGFHVDYQQAQLGVMDRDHVRVLLVGRGAGREAAGAYFYVRDADALHAELVASGARVQGEPVSHPWGLRDFEVLDLEGNSLTFGQPFEEPSPPETAMSDTSEQMPASAAPPLDERLFRAARAGDVETLSALLDAHPEALRVRDQPYEHTLLHVAARQGQLAAVDLLLGRGLDANVRERGDDTVPLHWAAAGGHLDVVRRLVDAGSELPSEGDDHHLGVIGWASCWEGCQDAAHRDVVDFLVSRGARHHVFSAIALELEDELRRIVAADPAQLERTMSHNENLQRPLHFAVRLRRARMVPLLLELGADPLGTDASGFLATAYARDPDTARPILDAIRARGGALDLASAVGLGDWDAADEILRSGAPAAGALHLMARQGNVPALRWLLGRGADPNALWAHWDADVTALHLAAMMGHADVVRLLLEAGADPRVPDSKHNGDAIGWAHHFGQREIVELLQAAGGQAHE